MKLTLSKESNVFFSLVKNTGVYAVFLHLAFFWLLCLMRPFLYFLPFMYLILLTDGEPYWSFNGAGV